MPLTPQERQAYAIVKYKRAKEALCDAENTSSSKRNRINRAYYAQFNCELSLLSAIGIEAGSSHAYAHSEFMNKFARDKSLNKSVLKKVHELQDLRHAADCSDAEPSQTDLKKALTQARDVFSMTGRYLLALYGEIMD